MFLVKITALVSGSFELNRCFQRQLFRCQTSRCCDAIQRDVEGGNAVRHTSAYRVNKLCDWAGGRYNAKYGNTC